MKNKILGVMFFSLLIGSLSIPSFAASNNYKSTISLVDNISSSSYLSDDGKLVENLSSYPVSRKCEGFDGSFQGDSLLLQSSLKKTETDNVYNFEGVYKVLDCKELTFRNIILKDKVLLSDNENFFGVYQRDGYTFNIILDKI